jgi:cytochrome c biogenesis protein
VRDSSGAVLFDDTVPFLPQDGSFTSTGVVKVPDASPQLGFTALFLPTTAVDDIRGPHSTFPEADDPSVFLSAWTGDLGLDGGVPQSIYTLETEGMEQIGLEALVPGQTWEFPQGSIEFTGFERWASFQIAHDPGKEVTLITAVLAMIGLILTLSVRRRRVWVKVDSLPDGRTLVQVAGIAREGGGEATREIAHVGRSLGAPAELIPEEDE